LGEYNSGSAAIFHAESMLGAKREKKRLGARCCRYTTARTSSVGRAGIPLAVRILAENPGPAGRNTYEKNLPTKEAQART